MANLKDTIVLGNLTVTGKITGAIDNSGGSGVSVINSNPTLSWGSQSTVATVGGTAITLTMPGYPNKVAQDYSTASKNYPLLFSATDGISSTSSRGDTTALLNNTMYANPSIGRLTGKILAATDYLHTGGYVSVYDDNRLYWGDDLFDGMDIDTEYYSRGIIVNGDYYLNFPAQSGTIALENTHPTFSAITLTSTIPLFFTGSGSGTYNRAVLYCDPTMGLTLENPLASDSATATEKPFVVSKRGGGNGTIKVGTANVNKIQSNSYTSVSFTATSTGWAVPPDDTYGCIYPASTNNIVYGCLGHEKQRWWKLFCALIGTADYPCGQGHFTNLYKGGSSVSTSDVRLKNSVTNTTLEALPIINNLHILNYQLNSFTQEQERLKRQKEKARITMAQLPKTKENRKLRKELQEIISTPNRSNYKDIGVSAQELEELLPDPYKATFVRKEATSNYSDQRYICDDNLVYLVIKGMQEQQQIINTQQQQIQMLEDRLQRLEARIAGDA